MMIYDQDKTGEKNNERRGIERNGLTLDQAAAGRYICNTCGKSHALGGRKAPIWVKATILAAMAREKQKIICPDCAERKTRLYIEYTIGRTAEAGPGTEIDQAIKNHIIKLVKKHGWRYLGSGADVITGKMDLVFYRKKKKAKRGRRRGRHALSLVPK